jgi:dimethylamine monooxygenase subunit C
MTLGGVKSKPVYAPLSADISGRFHLMLGRAEGEVALRRVLRELSAAAPALLPQTQVLFTPSAAGGSAEPFEALAAQVRSFKDTQPLLEYFDAVLQGSRMGTRLYIAGPESFIGRVMQIALRFNLNKDEIRAEELGSLARRVHCVHCRATTEEVRTNITRCSGCARWLTVRDHYSRRLAAYMGVMADAETPGELPPIHELYP